VLVAEFMLQQTQVARVVERYGEFLGRYPTPATCADAGPGALVRAWAGLGYNRRAVRLHACAAAIAERHGGTVPDRLEALLALPGIGPYTARAVLVFAYERDVAVLDTNVHRVLSRLAGSPLRSPTAQRLADVLVPPGRGWHWNQALIDHGAVTCTARAPGCDACALAGACAWRGRGQDPAARPAGAGQAPFAGSDREGRGRVVAALRAGPVALADLAAAAGWPDDPERARRIGAALVADELAVEEGAVLRLPRGPSPVR
jgi:A/G-specific adenine glycosylase